MKKLLLPALMIVLTASCSKKDPEAVPEARGGTLKVEVQHQMNGSNADFGKMIYQNAAGDSIQIDLIKHYLSNFEFHSPETGWKKVEKYKLVEYNLANTKSISFDDMPFGNYDSIRFYMGIDSAANHNLDQFGELDPTYSMLWSWNTGYIFIKYEGKFVSNNGVVLPFAYHIGGDNFQMAYTLPIAHTKTLTKTQTTAKIGLNFELQELFQNPNPIELDSVPLISHTMDEPALTELLRQNLLNAYSAE